MLLLSKFCPITYHYTLGNDITCLYVELCNTDKKEMTQHLLSQVMVIIKGTVCSIRCMQVNVRMNVSLCSVYAGVHRPLFVP